MNANQSKLSWSLIAAGFLLLLAYGQLDMVMVLLPVAAVLGYGFLLIGRKVHHRGLGLK